MLEIILPVKQVPEPGAVRIDEKTGTVIRKGAGSVINPLDLHAVETALRLKDTEGAHIGLGVSGAIQHLIGMRTSETIVAVNKDPDAPIFKVADFAITGDCMELLPHLKNILGKGGLK